MARGVYVGVVSNVPTYESADEINTSALKNWFDITNGSYYFKAEDEMTEFISNNKGVNNSTATTTLKSKYNIDLEFNYSYSSEKNYDLFTLTIAGATIEDEVSGPTTTKTWSGSLTAGQEISFTYKKDSSTHSNNDECRFNFSYIRRVVSTTSKPAARKVKNIYVGVNGVARRIKKGYIGVGGVARLCYITPGVHRYGTTTALSIARDQLAATTIDNYALFAGGMAYDGSTTKTCDTVDAYNSSLTRSTPTALSVARSPDATTVGNYALFAGGGIGVDTVDAYNSSLTRSTTTALSIARYDIGAATVGNYALFAGGNDVDAYITTRVDAYDTSLTRSRPTALSVARGDIGATTIGNYALFAGGFDNYIDIYSALSNVDAYDTSLTRSRPTALSVARVYHGITTVGNYALIAGGSITVGYKQADVYSSVDAYDTSLTRSIAPALSIGRNYLAAASSNGYAIFAGGSWSYNSEDNIVDAYDSSLVRSILTQLNTGRYIHAMASINQYVLVAGGRSSVSTNSIEVYMCLQQ